MGKHDAIAWSPEMDILVGTDSDAKVGAVLGIREDRVRYRRRKLGRPTYRSTRGPVSVECANCGKPTPRKQKAQRRSRRLYCGTECAAAGQKTRDSDVLRYGPGWKALRESIRERDKTCRVCGKTPEENGEALQVNHLVPFRFGGTNRPENLVALCESCHHRVDAIVASALAAILIEVRLVGSSLTVAVEGETRWRGSALGAPSLIETGSAA